jgi:hypothetical protein
MNEFLKREREKFVTAMYHIELSATFASMKMGTPICPNTMDRLIRCSTAYKINLTF